MREIPPDDAVTWDQIRTHELLVSRENARHGFRIVNQVRGALLDDAVRGADTLNKTKTIVRMGKQLSGLTRHTGSP